MYRLLKIALFGAAVSLPGVTATAQSIVSTGQSFVTGRIIPGYVASSGARLAGLQMVLKPGWKTYWRSPGEAGVPPSFDWSQSRNVASVHVHWPAPTLFESFGMRTAGYEDAVTLPLEIVPIEPAKPMDITLIADVGVCRELCVFERMELTQAVGHGVPTAGKPQIDRALASVPVPAADAGLTHAVCEITGAGRDRSFAASVAFSGPVAQPVVLLEGNENLWVSGDRSVQLNDEIRVTATVTLPDGVSWIDRSAIRMTVLADGFAADIQGCKAPTG